MAVTGSASPALPAHAHDISPIDKRVAALEAANVALTGRVAKLEKQMVVILAQPVVVPATPPGLIFPPDVAFGFTARPAIPAAPTLLVDTSDPTWGTTRRRMTNAHGDRHAYSRATLAWSCNGDRILCNFSGGTSNKIISYPSGAVLTSFGAGELGSYAIWSTTDNNKILQRHTSVLNRLVWMNATTKGLTTILDFDGTGGKPSFTTISIGEFEGGISDDDRYVSIIGDIAGAARLVTVDLTQGNTSAAIIGNIAAPAGIGDSQISPSGTYVTVGCAAGKRRYVRDLSSSIVLTANNNHADSAINAAGEDVLVCNNPTTGDVTAFRMSDGAPTVLLGAASNAIEYGHVGRARQRNGWIYFSIYDCVTTAGRPGFDQLLAAKIDTSGIVEVFGFAMNSTDGSIYVAQPHMAPRPGGDVVAYASDHGAGATPVYLYTARMGAHI